MPCSPCLALAQVGTLPSLRTCLEETAPLWYPKAPMSTAPHAQKEPLTQLPPRLRRTLELVYAVQGVVAARVWQSPGQVAVGVRGGAATAPASLLDRVQSAVSGLQEPGEKWEFGILEDVGTAEVQAGRLTQGAETS
jgi:hypothetical protein